MISEFPNKDDWLRISNTYSFERFEIAERDFELEFPNGGGLRNYHRAEGIKTCKNHLKIRLAHVVKSYVMLMFYYGNGIPSQELDTPRRDNFNYYADVLFYKIFSCFDSLWHILNLHFDMGLRRAAFKNKGKFRKILNRKSSVMQKELEAISHKSVYKDVKSLRDDITHNLLPYFWNSGFIESDNGGLIIGPPSCTTAYGIIEHVRNALDLFAETLECVKANLPPKPDRNDRSSD